MTEQEVFVLADQTLLKVIEQVKDDQWELKIPEWFPKSSKQGDMTLRQIINYHAYDDAWVPDMLAGKTMDEAGKAKFDGDLLGDDPKAAFAALVGKACAAAQTLDNPGRTVHCSFGDYPAQAYLWQINSFRGLRARDIAKLIGVDATLPPELVQGLWDELSPHAEEWRVMGVYGPKVEVPDGASLQDKLLGLTGRQP